MSRPRFESLIVARHWLFHWWLPGKDKTWKALGGRVIYYGWGYDVRLPFGFPRRFLTVHTRGWRAAHLSDDGTPSHPRAIRLFGVQG